MINQLIRRFETWKKGYSVEVEPGGTFRIGRNCVIGRNVQIIVRRGASLTIGDHCRIDENSYLVVGGNARIGNHCSFAHHLELRVPEKSRLVIGDDAVFSYNIMLRTTDGHLIFDEQTGKEYSHNRGTSILIDRHVWVGMGCCILQGTEIGKDSVIGAMSLVRSRVPAGSLAVGNPLRVIRENVNWDVDPKAKKNRRQRG